jgi:hypothetical protein
MPLTAENTGAALIGGRSIPREMMMLTKKVKVVRAFYFNREIQKKDAVVELPSLFASEMIAAKKAEAIEPVAVEPTVDLKTDTAQKSEPGARSARKEADHVGK